MNAKTEFLRDTKGYKIIGVCVFFGGSYDDYNETKQKFILPLLYTKEQYGNLMRFLDRDYDNGYGGQQLFGTIMCEYGVWFDRDEYDGAESWKVNEYPNLKEIFGEKNALKYERKKKLEEIRDS